MTRELDSPSPQYSGTPLTIVLTVAIISFFFIGFLSLYFCKCIMQNFVSSWQQRNNVATNNNAAPTGAASAAPPPTNPGLDPKIVQSFPTFLYSSVKDYRKEKYGLECAICLIEFENDDVLRFLTLCCHVFHQECIDLWLGFHTTCPVCRRGLDEFSGSAGDNMQDIIEDSALEDSYVSPIKDDETGVDESERMSTGGNGEHHRDEGQRNNNKSLKFSRSHSTGHSIVKDRGEGEDKFTLRLPEHVKAKIIKGHNPTRSCITFGKTVEEKNGGFVETSVSYGGDVNININRV